MWWIIGVLILVVVVLTLNMVGRNNRKVDIELAEQDAKDRKRFTIADD